MPSTVVAMFSPLSRTGLPTTIPEHPERQKYVCVLKAFDGYSKRVVHTRQEAIGGTGTLADTHEGKPGLPRGRSRLPAPAVQASQRERLLRAVVAAVADANYTDVTVADIVRRARSCQAWLRSAYRYWARASWSTARGPAAGMST